LKGETGHALKHLAFLEEVGDPATGEPIGTTVQNLKSAIVGETHVCPVMVIRIMLMMVLIGLLLLLDDAKEYTDMYPGMARTAESEGFDEIAAWFNTLAMAEKSHAGRFQKALKQLESEQ
jgi:rubrerythrin